MKKIFTLVFAAGTFLTAAARQGQKMNLLMKERYIPARAFVAMVV